MKRTTVVFNPGLLKLIKEEAAVSGQSFRAFLEDLVKIGLRHRSLTPKKQKPLKLTTFKGEPGGNITSEILQSRSALFDILD